jgi:DNA-binding response OmpR family regulator
MRVLIVEDEKKVASFLSQALEEAGFLTDVALDGAEGLSMSQTNEYDLILLDHLLPHMTGRELCNEIRAQHKQMPILMVTASDSVPDRVAGLDAGADDYLIKPFSLDELLARVRALLRRRATVESVKLQVEDLILDQETRHAIRGSVTYELTAREYELLDYLMRNARRPVTRAQIAEHVWGFDFDAGTNVIDVYINYLRNKIDKGSEHKLIHTVRQIGYQLG